MKRSALVLSLLFVAVTAVAQNFPNANVTRLDGSRGVAAAIRGIGAPESWVAWEVPIAEGATICHWNNRWKECCGDASLEGGNRGFSTTDDIKVRGSGTMVVAVKMNAAKLTRVRVFNGDCDIKSGAVTVHWLDNVAATSSVDFLADHVLDTTDESSVIAALAEHDSPNVPAALERLAAKDSPYDIRKNAIFWLGVRGGEQGFRFLRNVVRGDESREIRKKAVFAISQSKVPAATQELIDLARNSDSRDIRRESLFWLGQKAGAKAAAELRRAVDEDPDEDVKEHAVFAISQLPRERSVPMLIDLARTHKSGRVREKAIFWLVQTGDDRALAVIEEILGK